MEAVLSSGDSGGAEVAGASGALPPVAVEVLVAVPVAGVSGTGSDGLAAGWVPQAPRARAPASSMTRAGASAWRVMGSPHVRNRMRYPG